jgi:hypothetical protein
VNHTLRNAVSLVIGFARHHLVYTAVGMYGVVAVLLHRTAGWDLFPPCLWTLAFGVRCPGCGLTTATLHLLEFDLAGAAHANPMVFAIVPTLVGLAAAEFVRYAREIHPAG